MEFWGSKSKEEQASNAYEEDLAEKYAQEYSKTHSSTQEDKGVKSDKFKKDFEQYLVFHRSFANVEHPMRPEMGSRYIEDLAELYAQKFLTTLPITSREDQEKAKNEFKKHFIICIQTQCFTHLDQVSDKDIINSYSLDDLLKQIKIKKSMDVKKGVQIMRKNWTILFQVNKLKNFFKSDETICSQSYYAAYLPWNLMIKTIKNDCKLDIGLYLQYNFGTCETSKKFLIKIKTEFRLISQKDRQNDHVLVKDCEFNNNQLTDGIDDFASWAYVYNSEKGFVIDDSIVIQAKLRVDHIDEIEDIPDESKDFSQNVPSKNLPVENDIEHQKEESEMKIESSSASTPNAFTYNSLLHSKTKPPYTYSTLIFMAIQNSPNKKLKREEIQSWIATYYPYFKIESKTSLQKTICDTLKNNTEIFKSIEENGSIQWTIKEDLEPHLKVNPDQTQIYLNRGDTFCTSDQDNELSNTKTDTLNTGSEIPRYVQRLIKNFQKCSINECDSALSKEDKFKKYIETLIESGLFKCPECDKSFSRPDHLKTHRRIHDDPNEFKCLECNLAFICSTDLKRHRNTVHNEPEQEMKATKDSKRKYKDLKCHNTFSNEEDLELHQLHEEKQFKCSICFKEFSSISNVYQHKMTCHYHRMTSHNEVKPYACSKCDCRFSNSSSLISHIRYCHKGFKKETDSKNFECPECGKSFSSMEGLQDHQLMICF